MTARCHRCATTAQPIDTFEALTNGISVYVRRPLCGGCRTVVHRAIDRALEPVGLAVGI